MNQKFKIRAYRFIPRVWRKPEPPPLGVSHVHDRACERDTLSADSLPVPHHWLFFFIATSILEIWIAAFFMDLWK